MIVLDTNVISEAMKAEPHPSVHGWLNNQAGETLFLSSITLAELLFGIAALPLDTDAARRYADLAVMAKSSGRGFPTPDGYIAAIAASRGFSVASRDASPYIAAGVPFINPWNQTI